jgi:xanthine dehydrogenase molybdenum-binding subunit
LVNPDAAVGQLEGGLSRGAGFAFWENNAWDAHGQLASKGYMVDAKIPGVSESPHVGELSAHFADTYEPSGPFGAKGIGEATLNPVPAAYANAIYNAIGVRFYELPITPEKILSALGALESESRAPSSERVPAPEESK